jgi:hypothetical protein
MIFVFGSNRAGGCHRKQFKSDSPDASKAAEGTGRGYYLTEIEAVRFASAAFWFSAINSAHNFLTLLASVLTGTIDFNRESSCLVQFVQHGKHAAVKIQNRVPTRGGGKRSKLTRMA